MTEPTPATPPPGATPAPRAHDAESSPQPGPSFERRMEAFGQEVEDAASRWTNDPGVKQNLTLVGRFWGLFVLGVGIWLLAGVTLGYDLPSVPLRDLWPVALIVLGGAVIVRGFGRRT